MSITAISRDFNDEPNIVRLISSDTLATVAGANYLTAQADNIAIINKGTWVWESSDLVLVSASNGNALFTLNASFTTLLLYSTAGNGAVSLPVVANDFVVFDGVLGALKDLGFSASDPSKTKVIMAGSAVLVNHIAKFIDVAGTIDDTPGIVINSGNIQAGLSGTSGTLISFPAGAASGSLILAAVTNGSGNFNTTISNAAAVGQSQVISIPDSGVVASNFILSDSAGTQSIATGNLTLTLGNLIVSAGTILAAAGDITAGSPANAGKFVSNPPGAANGTLILQATNAGGAFNTTIANGTMGQSSVYTIPDVGAATGNIVVSTTASKPIVKNVEASVVAGGAAAQTIVDAFCTATSIVIGNWVTQTNPASVLTIVPGVGSFVVTSSADPGASTFSYIIMK